MEKIKLGRKLDVLTEIFDGFAKNWYWFAVYIILGLVFLSFLYPTPVREPTIVTYTIEYSGVLVMVSYENSWFGLGGPERTFATIQNGSDPPLSFHFPSYYILDIGSNYTVYEEVVVTTYFDCPISEPFSFFLPFPRFYVNSTETVSRSIIVDLGVEN